ncbi:hypothetical protein CFE70_000195 [Pyrenophora teres f. teres 0-1]
MSSLSLEATLYLFHHFVLPPKLPQESDWKAEYEDALLDTTVEVLQSFGGTLRNEQPQVAGHIDLVASAVQNLRCIRDPYGFIIDSELARLLHDLASSKTSETVPIEIKAQNAAVIVSKQNAGTHVVFEVFELSPPNETVMRTKGRLKRSFPTYACQIPLKQFQEQGLIEALAHTLSRMSLEEAPDFQPQTRKNKKEHIEIRDTTHPGLVTDFLMHLLSVVGQPIDVQGIWKNTREDVLLHRALLPWRRSPFWLLIRTTMQLQLSRTSSANVYKAVMIHLLARLLKNSDLLYVISAKLTGRLQKLRNLIPGSSFNLYTKSAQKLLEEVQLQMTARAKCVTNSMGNNFQPTSTCLVYLEHELPTNFSGSGEYKYFYLATVEKWVEDHLSSWVDRRISVDTTCEKLRQLLEEYFHQASSAYSAASDIPRSLSTMYLTVMELWIACDKCACSMYPLLRDFEPEVELSSFQSLSLPFKSQLERLFAAEAYLQRRREDARANAPSLYRDFGHPSSFAVRFFDESLEHRQLLTNIERRAMVARQEKRLELAQKKQQYHDLIAASDKLCDLKPKESKFKSMNGRSIQTKRSQKQQFSNYKSHRPTVTGVTRRWSHYRVKNGVAFLQEKDICVENALQYQYFDSSCNTFIGILKSTQEVSKKCTYQLPARSSKLQAYLQTPITLDDITPNQVIARLSDCPSHFSLDEYKAFGSLPIGYGIQYQNILVQLAMPAIDLNKIETQCLLLQTIHRAGPPTTNKNPERIAHEILIDESFCQALIYKIEAALRRISENWETWRAVATLVQVTLRILSINASNLIAARCTELLEKARLVSLTWLNRLKKRLPTIVDDAERKELSSRLTEIGLLFSELLQASIVVQENKDATSSEHEYLHCAMLQSWRLLLLRALPVLVRNISSDTVQEGLNKAVAASWASFCPTNRWSVLGNPQHHWIYVRCGAQVVHFNLLTAELLVNGLPLSRLPVQYTQHHLYSSLFDKMPIEVMSTDEPGMEFCAMHPFHPDWCYNLSFGMEDSDMFILAARGGTKFDLVPSRVFKGQLPTLFVDDYFHWYDHDTEEVEFRTRDDPWASYKEMVIDVDQQIGTLSGLATILVLKSEQGVENRLALILEGDVTYSTTAMGHVSVSVKLDTAWTTHAYQVDEILGRLIDNGSLQSKLFLCYLHALTSHCLPDALTGHTGTEAALSILRSGAAASFDVLTAANIVLLKAIAQLTPERKFYPAHLKVMQEVHWDNNLPSMSQSPDFYTAVKELFTISRRTKLLHSNDVYIDPPKLDFVKLHLLERDMIRTSSFRVDGFGAEHRTHDFDQRYEARANVADSQRGLRSSVAAGMIFRNQATLHSSVYAHRLQNSLRTVHLHDATVQGLNTQLDPPTLRYDASWLANPSSFLPDMWCNLHSLLARTPYRFNKFDLMIWLSTAAFAESADMDVIQALAAFYNCRDLASINIPSVPSFDLAEGDSPTLSAIQSLVRIYQPYEACPEYLIPQLLDEEHWQCVQRRRTLLEMKRSKAVDAFARALHEQWPCEVPTTPCTQFAETYLDTRKAMSEVRPMFKIWYDNRCFYQYLKNVSDTLERQMIACVETKDMHVLDVQNHSEEINGFSFYGIKDVFNLEAPASSTACQSPRISPTFWLRQLNRDRFDTLTESWKRVVIGYGLAVTELQRARRLLALSSHPHEFAEELRNRGHQNWEPMKFPETLLLEAESGLLIREVQEEIAEQMRRPPNNANSVMQLNMGEGKSSVIVPIIAAFLAQGKLLVRVIVAKSQSRQMFQMLVSKIGGLLNRRIYHMPFSRALKLSSSEANAIGEIYQECRANRGILLVQPEHILSFKLMGIECLLNGQPDVGRSLQRTQSFFDKHSRDIVDESDENFSVKFELVYTMGTQLPIQLSPERWIIVHSVLGLVAKYAAVVEKLFPSSIEFEDHRGSRYPRTRILGGDAEEKLLDLICEHICEVGISGLFSIARQPSEIRQTILRYIRQSELTPGDVNKVEGGPFFTETNKEPLLLLRGLLAGGVLSFTLKSKRWRVNYGIDPSRKPKTQLAVPYRSKDSPSPRSEFSHPDVVIALTSLTYYYGGLNDQDLFDTFAHLEKSDQSDVEYEIWVGSVGALPEAFRHLTGINIKDRHQCTTDIFPWLRYSKGAIDYFLSHIVFPKAMKEFPYKLSASGWDLGAIKSHPTTGFSGTNDSRQVLPLSVHYLDPEKQKHTNALVLAYLLQEENSLKLLPPRTDAERLLNIIDAMKPPTRVILDAGAQILELSNIEVAETWLRISNSAGTKAKAVIFFNDNEELSVLDHNNCVESLQTSPFSKHLDECLVYLDQAHTRGTDLKMPKNYRAAVTLGANLTKDTLVQACMRMRKLGKGQSVIFCIPEEIQTKIMECTSTPRVTDIEVSDLLAWAITETWADMRRNISLWATQGHRYEDHKDCLNGVQTTVEQAKEFLEIEAQSLEDRYRPRLRNRCDAMKDWDTTNKNILEIVKRYRAFEAVSLDAATLQEEQERELSPEIEEEREVQRPARMEAEEHELHPDLVQLVKTGIFSARSDAFVPAFQALKSTSAATQFNLEQFPSDLLVTADFVRTVKPPGGVMSDSYISDSYLRPVQWILSVVSDDQPSGNRRLVILSPFEAEQLVARIKKSDVVTLHLYSPRPTQSYDPLDTLGLYCVGREFSAGTLSLLRSQIVQLNLFAGQLYFKSHTEYVELCMYLGLAWEAPKEGEKLQIDGFIVPPAGVWCLAKSPVGFLRDYIKTRREGEGIEKTHLGKVLEGGLLEKCEIDNE